MAAPTASYLQPLAIPSLNPLHVCAVFAVADIEHEPFSNAFSLVLRKVGRKRLTQKLVSSKFP
ncbi:MAG: hypothetical protein AAGH78_16030 [Cyanobacteria bacterium P01_H01_bin.58]